MVWKFFQWHGAGVFEEKFAKIKGTLALSLNQAWATEESALNS
jgi:hypothetical protein